MFAQLMASRGAAPGETDYSWTVDFASRRARARDEMQPHLDVVERLRAQAVVLKDEVGTLRKVGAAEAVVAACRGRLAAVEKSARESQASADVVDAATYDLKAVNPRAKIVRDTRTPVEVLDAIAEHGRKVDEALARLRGLTAGAVREAVETDEVNAA